MNSQSLTYSTFLAQYLANSALGILFVSGFLSATLLPGSSEAIILATLAQGKHHSITVITVATLGNTLGALSNYGIGWLLPNRFKNEAQGQRALQWIERYGYLSLLFAWLPIIGDPLCLAAGWLRMRFFPCTILIALGKALRYSFLAALFYNLI